MTINDKPEIQNEYYIGYSIMTEALKFENVYQGLEKALEIVKEHLQLDGAFLLKYDEKKQYKSFISKNDNSKVEQLINQSELLSSKEYIVINVDDDNVEKIALQPIIIKDNNYVLICLNDKIKDYKYREIIYNIIKEAFTIILSKMEDYEAIRRISEEDVITGFGNRLAYSKKVEEEDGKNGHVVYTIVDIFRLKYVNDNYGHKVGDLYIKKVAEILQKYFPEFYISTEIIPTGDHIYRIGGDEFAIISNHKSKEDINNILEHALEEIKQIDLSTDAELPLAMNYGIAERTSSESMDELYQEADKNLSSDKRKMYQKLGINRRK